MEILSQADLRAELTKAEHEFATGAANTARLAALSASAVHWVKQSKQTQLLRRLAALLAGTGDTSGAVALLRTGNAIAPHDIQIALTLSDALALENDFGGALDILAPTLTQLPPPVRCVKRSIKLYQRMGQFDEALALARNLSDRVPAQAGVLVSALVAADRQGEALSRAREVLATKPEELSVIQACYKALAKLGAEEAEIADVRTRLLAHADASGSGPLLRAQLLERDSDTEAAIVQIERGLAAEPENSNLLKRRAEIALEQGYWGRDAKVLLKARPLASPFSQLADGIAKADTLLNSYGGSLEFAARAPGEFVQIKSPECVFERIVRESPPPDTSGNPSGVVMVAGSLGGYGAERVLANTFRLFANQRRFDWTKFYVADFAKRTSKEFILPLTGIPHSDVVVLEGTRTPEPPLAWIGGTMAVCASRIFAQLRRDRPMVVHASLEPLNVYAGLAAVLAGVPRIVLHTHNMRPTELNIRNAPRLKGCFQALLARPEVVLAGCARACIDDYMDWLGLNDPAKTYVVYNGYEFEEIVPADAAARTALRAEFGIAPDATVIGTAIRITAAKQPLLWVDAAAEIFAHRPDCRFIMFGDGGLRHQVEQRVREKGLSSCFILPGRVTDLYRRLPLLDLFMLCSRTEGLPNALIEAQAAGVPVVAFDVGGVAETMIPGETGLLVKESSAGAMAATVLGAVADPQWRERAAAAGPKFVRGAFGIEKMIVTLSDIFAG
jgi:glycosyltransferase involved in cell wall biosynthesis